MQTLSQYLSDILPGIVYTKDPNNGDFQWNGAFKLAKGRGVSPRVVAEEVAATLRAEACFAKVEVAGAGFVNLTLSDEWLARQVVDVMSDPYVGVPQDNSRTVVVDYSSPNVAKRMHVGHLRSTVIGNAIDRLNRACGHRTIGDNHLGDWGTQFGKLIVAWNQWADEAAFEVDPVTELERLYVKFNEEGDEDEARAATVALQNGAFEETLLWQQFVDASKVEYNAVYRRLSIEFDMTRGESTYENDLDPLVERLLINGIAIVSDGAVVVPVGDEIPPLLIRKSDGASLYGTTDLATVDFRVKALNPDTIIYVTDMRQALHFRQVFRAARAANLVPAEVDLVHVGFGMLRLPVTDEAVVMSSRKGNTIPLVKLLDEAHSRARAFLDSADRFTHVATTMTEAEKESVAEAVGISSILYADLSRDPTSDVTFEWDRVLSLEGNTAPYLMYALARCHGISRKAGVAPLGKLVLTTPEERALALSIGRYPDAIVAATDGHRPNVLAAHLYDLASTFFKFYGVCNVISPEGVVDGSRLGLVRATMTVLYAGFRILGLRPLERM
jgi:arginyl-tRNA synthetase